MLRVEERLERVEERLENKIDKNQSVLIAKLDNIQTSVSNFAGRVETLGEENEIGTEHTRELRVQFEDHEKRIAKLESSN